MPDREKPLISRPSQLLTIPEAADRLRCSPNHVYRLIAAGKLRAIDVAQPGARRAKTRVTEHDVAEYIQAGLRTASTGAA